MVRSIESAVVVMFGLLLLGCNDAPQKPSSASGSVATSAEDAATDDAESSVAERQDDDDSTAGNDPDEESDVPEGHSHYGESFDEGPRQQAQLMGGTGKIDFPVTTSKPLAQKFINQGVGQFHGFWFYEAERSFRQAAHIDPACAMAYWGMAMTNFDGESDKRWDRALGFIQEAVERSARVTGREKMYINTLATFIEDWGEDPENLSTQEKKALSAKRREASLDYVKTMFKMISKYPDDIDAKAFLAIQIYWNQKVGIRIKSRDAVDTLLRQVLKVEPMHPCHHYVIHLWDGKDPKRAMGSAEKCGQSAPNVAHMWHMPGHIYKKMKMYQDAVWHQEASARVDHAQMIRDRLLPDQIFNYPHNNDWFMECLGYVGRVSDAADLAKNMVSLPRHPEYNALTRVGKKYAKRSAYYGRLALLNTLRDWELWDQIIELAQTPYIEKPDVPIEEIRYYRYLGWAYYRKGDVAGGDAQLVKLADLLRQKEAARSQAKTSAERKTLNSEISWTKRTMDVLLGFKAIHQQDYARGVMLLERSNYVNKKFRAEPLLLAGQEERAIRELRDEVRQSKNEVLPLALLVKLLWDAGRQREAAAAFRQLREVSGMAELETPVLARLAPVAKELGFPRDWRIPKPLHREVGTRPPLDSLGPFRWSPPKAPAWSLPDADGRQYALKDYRGKPVIIIFYLGHACLHCNEQLQEFGPLAADFARAGIEMIAISTDDQSELQMSLEGYLKGDINFPLVSDAENNVFKLYRCYDDFEEMPLHGTFLVDGQGLVRWHDTGPEPFLEPEFLLEEAQRLLAQTDPSRYARRVSGPVAAAPAASAPAAPKPQGPAPTDTPAQAAVDTSPAAADDVLLNSIGMQLVEIPAGQFQMGSDSGVGNEQPAHQVQISKPLLVGRFEVTQAQYKEVMGSNPSTFPGADHPVDKVSWNDAVEFCRKLTELADEKSSGRVYRLPTEAEWEYACRAGTQSDYFCGDDSQALDQCGWYRENSDSQTHPVGQKQANAFGLHDMHGNVREWCQDWYAGDYYENSPSVDPPGPEDGKKRVFRGGSWGGTAAFCRASSRFSIHPNYKNDYVGFRVVVKGD